MDTRTTNRLGQLLVALTLLFLALIALPQTAWLQAPAPAAPDPAPAAVLTDAVLAPDCNNPPSGRQARLRAENEIGLVYRESSNKALGYGRINDNSGPLVWDTNTKITSPSYLTDIRWPAITTADLNGDGAREAVMAYRDKNKDLGVYVQKASGYDYWYSNSGPYGRHDGTNLSWIDVAAGNLNGPWGDASEEVVLVFRDDECDLHLVVLDGDSGGGIAPAHNSWNANYWKDNEGKGNVHYTCVATGDLNGDGYDNEIVVALQDSENDLQVLVFRWDSGQSGLTLVWWTEWTTLGRGYVAYGLDTAHGIDIAAGDVDADFQDEVIVAFADNDNGDQKIQMLLLNPTSAQGSTSLSFDDSTYNRLDPGRGYPGYSGWPEPASVSVAAADVDGNGKDEVVLAYATKVDYYSDETYVHMLTYSYTRSGPDGLTERNHHQYGGPGYEVDYYGRLSVAAGDIDLDGRAEFALAVRAQNGNVMIWAYDAEGSITYRGGTDHVCSSCDVDEFMLTMGDLNGDSSYANYTGTCYEVTDTQVSAVVHVPPHYSAYNRASGGTGTVAGFGKFVGGGSSTATSAKTSNAGSLTIDSSISFADIAEVGPSFTFEFEKSLDVSNEQAVMRTDGLHWSSDATAGIFDFVAFDQVTYWVYEYRESRSGQTFTLRIPQSSTPSTRRLDLWYANGPTEFPTSWVPVGRNLALGRPATQVSTYGNGVASRAVDGNTDGNYYNGSVSHTGYGIYSWWQVDLGSVQWVDAVQIWNRTDGSQSRLSNFYVFISDTPFSVNNPFTLANDPNVWHYYVSGQGGRPTTVPVNSHGRYVRVQLTVQQYLHMAEVQVWGHPTEVNQWPKERPQVIDDHSFCIKLPDGACQTVNGQLKWDWTATGGIQVDRGAAVVGWSTQEDTEWTTTTEETTAENVSVGFEAKVLGAGVEGAYTYGSETRTSHALTWGSGTVIDGQTGPLDYDSTPAGISYNYSPYLWVQKALSSGKVQQEFLVLDYWVSSIGNPLEDEPPQPITSKLITPTAPLIGSPSHPDPFTWVPTSTVVFTWTQPAGDPATVTGYRRYLDAAADTIPNPASNGLTTTHTYRNVPDGVWYLHVRAGSDADGQSEWSDTAHRAVRVDTQPPTVTLTLDPPQPTGHNGWYISPVTVAVQASDAGAGVTAIEVSADGVAWQPYAAPWHFVTDTMPTTLWARATDALGHPSAPVTTTLKVDLTPPSSQIHIGGQTIGVWIAAVVTDTLGNQHLVLGGVISDSLSGRSAMNLLVDGAQGTAASAIGVWHPFPTQPQIEVNWYYTATTELGRGNHIFQGWAQDEAGNLESPYQIAQVIWFPPDAPDLHASSMAVSPQVARPADVVNVTIAARNSGQQEAWVAVTDTLPAGLTPVTDTLGYGATYDPGSRTITWPAVLLWPGQWNRYTFDAQVDAGLGATVLENQATAHASWPNTDALTGAARQYFLDHEDTVVVTATVTVNPGLPAGADVTPPQVDLSILSGAVVNARDVTLQVLADADAHAMFLREWTLDPVAGAWVVAQESGWIPYSATSTWTLSPDDGVKYLGVWVADAARNVSLLDAHSLALINLVGSSQSLANGGRVQYRFDLQSATLAVFYLTAQAGDTDLYIWNPLNAFRPNRYSNNPDEFDELGFWAEEDGLYLVEVAAVGDSQYQLTLAGSAALAQGQKGLPKAYMLTEEEKPRPAHPLSVSDPLSAGSAGAPPSLSPYQIYLPLIARNG